MAEVIRATGIATYSNLCVNIPEVGKNGIVGVIYRLSVKWSDQEADLIYTLTKLHEYDNGERSAVQGTSGNKKWASRIAKRYDLKVPKEEQ